MPSLLIGAILDVAVYGVKMYGFTTIFPWFEASRDWITAAAYLVFGIAAIGVYKMLSQRQYADAHSATNER